MVSLEFDVQNVGTADANEVRVVVHASGLQETVFDETLSVPRGGFVHRSASWRVVEGPRAVHLVIDPEGVISELNEGNNVWESTVNGAPAPPYLAIAVGAVGASAALGLASFMRRRRTRRPVPGDEGKDT
jgi:subtilase family serine protease